MPLYEEFAARAARLEERLALACERSGRSPAQMRILPVTKNHPAEAAQWAFKYGFKSVGENRVQEALSKIPACPAELEWELIGHLQGNKAKAAALNFSRVQSADGARLLDRLNAALEDSAEGGAQKKLRVLLQINSGKDPAKFGAELEEAPALLEHLLEKCPLLEAEGLMAIAPLSDDSAVARKCFESLRLCAEDLRARFGLPLAELSMGMSDDMEEAVMEGSTMIRIGTALFGERL